MGLERQVGSAGVGSDVRIGSGRFGSGRIGSERIGTEWLTAFSANQNESWITSPSATVREVINFHFTLVVDTHVSASPLQFVHLIDARLRLSSVGYSAHA